MPQETLAALIDALLAEDHDQAEELAEMLKDEAVEHEEGLSDDPEAANRVAGYMRDAVRAKLGEGEKPSARAQRAPESP